MKVTNESTDEETAAETVSDGIIFIHAIPEENQFNR
jgi:hypothetical protein